MQDLFSTQNQKLSTLPDDRLRASEQRRSGKNGSGRMRPKRAPSEARSEQTELFEQLPKKATPHTLEQVLKQKTFIDFWDYQSTLIQWNQ